MTACGSQTVITKTPTPKTAHTATITQSATLKPQTATPTSTPRASRILSICLSQEPKSLFWYADTSKAALNVWQAMNDGPFDFIGFEALPVIVERAPNIQNGNVIVESVPVKAGDLILDASGKWAALNQGTSYRPDQCFKPECAKVYAGNEPVNMNSLRVKFQLKAGLFWSDCAPLTADDSVYAFEVARKLYPLYAADIMAATTSYLAVDELTVEWRGLPGYVPPAYHSLFFVPMPRHAWGLFAPEDLLSAEISSRQPLSWGAYKVDQWISGDHITLSKNPFYFRASEGLPKFDSLVFRFLTGGEEAIQAVLAGECDLVDEFSYSSSQIDQINELANTGKLGFALQKDTGWEQILFGMTPYPEGRLSKLAQKEVRQAITMCIDREKILQQASAALAAPADNFVLPENPLYNPDIPRYTYDPQKAGKLLSQAGWLDSDNDPATPRLSVGVPNLPDGTPFELTYLTTNDEERQTTALLVKESLAQCGIKVAVEPLTWETLLAAGPEGPVFGRNFDLAQFGWSVSYRPACSLFTSEEVPGPYPDFPKGWGGGNASGYSNSQYDQACSAALACLPGSPEQQQAHFVAQALLFEDPPLVPLYWRGRLLLTRPDFCGLSSEVSAKSNLWKIETFNYGEDCQKD